MLMLTICNLFQAAIINLKHKVDICTSVTTEINQLCYLHRITSETVQKMTRTLSVPLMLITLFQFLVVLTESYYNYISLMNNFIIQYSLYGQTLSSTLFILMCLLQFYYSISLCTNMTEEAEATATLLNKIYLEDVDYCVEQSIEMFILEMLHQDYRIRLYDCYAMDFTFAYSVSNARKPSKVD
ncbi:uncharacterized protein LOC134221487 [Armigeres subalbatus]|uniref:uncharacterized protein LOC134221487 n=1 Tax=Armigeres subalbatus TaxID=124917 RepID=UPI002ED233A1